MRGRRKGGEGRLTLFAAAFVVARRDFMATLLSRSFLFFLLGPLFPIGVTALAAGAGQHLQDVAQPRLGVAMAPRDVDALGRAHQALDPQLGGVLPGLVVVRRLAPGEAFDPHDALADRDRNVAAILTGTLREPVLTGAQAQIDRWRGPVSLLAGTAIHGTPGPAPAVALQGTVGQNASDRSAQLVTAQGAQTLLFLLTMLLAGMVLSNLVEEKSNKVIEVLAAAIPMDAVFFGKLFAMLGVSLVGISVWGSAWGLLLLATGADMSVLAEPAVGWAAMIALGVVYFAMAYLLLGSFFLALGSLASTVREVQTLSMPATMAQVLVFFLSSYAMARPGSGVELAAAVIPFSSPYVMLARAAQQPGLGQHVLAVGWQAFCVAIAVRAGATLFRKRVMKSGPAGSAARWRFWSRRRARTQP